MKVYKLFLIGVITLFIVLYSIFSVTIGDWLGIVIGMLYPVLLIAIWFPQMKKSIGRMKELSYDEENLYVMEKGYEIQIPFHQVKYIEILSLDGLYKFTLYHHDQFGDEVTCKPSIWYPLNYKRVDKELNRIRTLVRKAHKNYKEQIENNKSLASFN